MSPRRRPGWLLVPLALAACGTPWPPGCHVDPLPAAPPATAPWLAPELAEPGQRPPLSPRH